MAYTLGNKSAKNCCKRTILVTYRQRRGHMFLERAQCTRRARTFAVLILYTIVTISAYRQEFQKHVIQALHTLRINT